MIFIFGVNDIHIWIHRIRGNYRARAVRHLKEHSRKLRSVSVVM